MILPFRVYSLSELLQLCHLFPLPSDPLEQAFVWLEMEVVLDLSETWMTLVFLFVIKLGLKVLSGCASILVERCPRYL